MQSQITVLAEDIDISAHDDVVGRLQGKAIVVLHYSHCAGHEETEASLANQMVWLNDLQFVRCAVVLGVCDEQHVALTGSISDQPACTTMECTD